MGGSQSTVSVTEDFLPLHPPLETNAALKDWHYVVPPGGEATTRPHRSTAVTTTATGSGGGGGSSSSSSRSGQRMYASFRVKCGAVTAVLKVAYLQRYNASEQERLSELDTELKRIQELTRPLKHVWPVTAWFGPNSFKGVVSIHPVVWLRPAVYTTLHDRLVHHRPWLTVAEKWFLILQLFKSVQSLHDVGLVHGNLTTHNIACTSIGWLVLVDVMPSTSSKFRPLTLPHDDPTEYLYSFANKTSPSCCCLAPERFDSNNIATATGSTTATGTTLTTAMDVFSLGCCLVELALNGEPCFDLGQLLEYRRTCASVSNNNSNIATTTQHLQQKLQKISSSALRAACRHMLHVDPSQRLSKPIEYWQRLEEQDSLAPVVPLLNQLYELLHTITSTETPDARLLYLYQAYPEILFQTMGVKLIKQSTHSASTEPVSLEKENKKPTPSEIWAETEALLKELETFTASSSSSNIDDFMSETSLSPEKDQTSSLKEEKTFADPEPEPRTPLQQGCLLIYVQQVLSTVRHVQRPATKVKALQLLHSIVRHVSDEVRLQRIVPTLVYMLKDVDSTVRATACQNLAQTLALLTSFPPSDAQVMPRYILKRMAPLLTDPCLLVRVALASHLGALAETSLRFLDIAQAVRLVQAVESGGSASTGTQTPLAAASTTATVESVFEERVTQLLDDVQQKQQQVPAAAKQQTILVRSSYRTERASLVETMSRWVVHICTDQSEHASLVKRALLQHALPGLCHFFALDEVMGFMLPQLLAFLNDRQDAQLRAALFQGLPVVCQVIGRGATEEFVLPCIEIGLVSSSSKSGGDAPIAALTDEQVIGAALQCLGRLIEQGLLSRALVVLPTSNCPSFSSSQGISSSPTLLERYSAFLIHPSKSIRRSAIHAFCATCRALGSPDAMVYITPMLMPFLRFQPSWKHLSNESEMTNCLKKPWTRKYFNEQKMLVQKNTQPWTTIVGGIRITDMADSNKQGSSASTGSLEDTSNKKKDPMAERMRSYLQMLAKQGHQGGGGEHGIGSNPAINRHFDGIEGSLKLAQSVVFPRRSAANNTLPDWFRELRDKAEESDSLVSEASAIRSVSALGSVYGLSIVMGPGPAEGGAPDETAMIGAAEIARDQHSGDSANKLSQEQTDKGIDNILDSTQSLTMEEAFMGRWESEVLIDPDVVDTSLLVTKLKALKIPTLAPPLGDIVKGGNHGQKPTRPPVKEGAATTAAPTEWKPRMSSMIASSSPLSGHSAPVVRLAVALDSSFFVSASHDGTCGVWEVSKLEDSTGFLDKSATYSGHNAHGLTRVNDIAMVEGTHSVVSGASNGTVHVWRVDMMSSSPAVNSTVKAAALPGFERREHSRVVGTSVVRQADPSEGEILAVSHFTSVSNSVIVYATQKGVVRTWDLRSAQEPFYLAHGPKLGHLSSMALGGDRNWIVTGTSRGFLALWDVRFQQPFKLWRHSRGEKIHRLAASFCPHPQTWGTPNAHGMSRPHVFVGSSHNECSMLDALSGSNVQCFRTVAEGDSYRRPSSDGNKELPSLVDVSGRLRMRNGFLSVIDEGFAIPRHTFSPTVNCMVGSIGGQSNSFLLTGGSDGYIRSWDFTTPSRSYIVAGEPSDVVQPRPTFERIDFDGSKRLIMCRQHPSAAATGPFATNAIQGLKKPEYYHTDSVEDLKVVDNSALISCSRDCTIKVWR